MTFDDLRVFVAVCQAGSLSAVARDLSCTQSAVSQHVKRLERTIGVRLLERRARGVVPTPEGLVLQAAAREGIVGLDLALRRLGELARGEAGSVRVTTGATTVRHFMSEAVVDFRARHPGANLEFRTETATRSCFDALAAGTVDLAWVTIGRPTPASPTGIRPSCWLRSVSGTPSSPLCPDSSPRARRTARCGSCRCRTCRRSRSAGRSAAGTR
ncbi:LysR family transcriptional regulator [Streptosporangium nondiastaticum]|uniref:LysR family transcriptional regulator n=1 Tax=Streptosporangium nondiastaticum TaxID=35764 RepID=UPI0031F7DCD5